MAPILKHLDPTKPFVEEVKTPDSEAEAVLLQCFGKRLKLHPVAFFSRKLPPTEQNYNIGNRELLAVRLAQEEWRCWLEGASHLFTIFTDHKNLEYLKTVKRIPAKLAGHSSSHAFTSPLLTD